jgi:2-dehydropantoate 2-reductase
LEAAKDRALHVRRPKGSKDAIHTLEPDTARLLKRLERAADGQYVFRSCVKLWDVESSGDQIRPLMGHDTAVIPLQNGVDASERLTPILGAHHVMGGTAVLTGSIVAPGVVRQSGQHRRIDSES